MANEQARTAQLLTHTHTHRSQNNFPVSPDLIESIRSRRHRVYNIILKTARLLSNRRYSNEKQLVIFISGVFDGGKKIDQLNNV